MQVPIAISMGLGLVYMLGRFIVVLTDDLKERPDSWLGVLLLLMMVGTVALISVAFCAAVGAGVGFVLRALARSLERHLAVRQ